MKLLLVPAAGATRCFLFGWLVARAGMLLGSQARPGAGLLTVRPEALGMALAGCCVLWHGLRVGLERLRVASNGAVDASIAGAGASMALARWAPDLASAQTELHASTVLSALRTLGGRGGPPRATAVAPTSVPSPVPVPMLAPVLALTEGVRQPDFASSAPRGSRSIAGVLGAACADTLAPTALACAASWWLLMAAPPTLPRGAARWLGSLSLPQQQNAAAAAAVVVTASWRSLAEAARHGWLRGARAHLCGAAPAALLLQHRALRRLQPYALVAAALSVLEAVKRM